MRSDAFFNLHLLISKYVSTVLFKFHLTSFSQDRKGLTLANNQGCEIQITGLRQLLTAPLTGYAFIIEDLQILWPTRVHFHP